jgi:DNA-binding beta-propeller fold protein YncE
MWWKYVAFTGLGLISAGAAIVLVQRYQPQALFECVGQQGLYQTHENDQINRCFERWCVVDATRSSRLYRDPNLQQLAHWAPNGRRFVAVSNGQDSLYTANADGKPLQLIYTNTNRQFKINQPIWSPDSQQIAFLIAKNDTTAKLFLIKLNSLKVTPIAHPQLPTQGYKQPIGWSPDGQHLYFTDVTDPHPMNGTHFRTLYRWTAKTQQLRKLVEASQGFSEFSLSLDGKQIALADDEAYNSKRTIHVINADGTNLRNLGQVGSNPIWSPNGWKIAFRDHGAESRSRDENDRRQSIGTVFLPRSPEQPPLGSIIYTTPRLGWGDYLRSFTWTRDSEAVVIIQNTEVEKHETVQIYRVKKTTETLTTLPQNLYLPAWPDQTPPWQPAQCPTKST